MCGASDLVAQTEGGGLMGAAGAFGVQPGTAFSNDPLGAIGPDGEVPMPNDADASTLDSGAGALDAALDAPHYSPCVTSNDCMFAGSTCYKSSLSDNSTGYCTSACTSSADCTAPSTGGATPYCSGIGVCQLACSFAITCPDGLSCASFGAAGACY